ncbi:MAG: glycerol-3-phosphate dehydrogenase/oxidase [Betaproteobacteria bacterium]
MSVAPPPLPTRRLEILARLGRAQAFDIAVVGGGATGLGIALDAAQRGLRVVLVESHDFAKGTSSRSTKLVHGGVRYLAQGNVALVREALHERRALLHNAPHIAQPLDFVVPAYRWWEKPFYGLGLKAYDQLAGTAGLGNTEFLTSAQALNLVPAARTQGLRGAVRYWDGQFNDARLAIAIARTAAQEGALLVNYCRAERLLYEGTKVAGLLCVDARTGQSYPIRSRCVVNATGVWVDALRQSDSEHVTATAFEPLVSPSQGVHLVVDQAFLGGNTALMVPKTSDGRVLFAVPWLGKVILGTTDTPRQDLPREPRALKAEVDFILREAGNYLRRAPTRADVRSLWVGLRPLVKHHEAQDTKTLSREHVVAISRSGLVTVTGGKWTTYRAMAQDVLSACQHAQLLARLAPCQTQDARLLGAQKAQSGVTSLSAPEGMHSYGDEKAAVAAMPGAQRWISPGLSEAMVRFAVRYEYALTVEDVLARRSRLLFLDAHEAAKAASEVAEVMRQEHDQDPKEGEFAQLATQFLAVP